MTGKVFVTRARELAVSVWKTLWKVGSDDPRRVVHAMKVGVALTLASLLYLLEPLFEGVGKNAMWAVMTVVVVLEFKAGATLCKGLNRGFGTLCAGSLAFVIEFIEFESGKSGRVFHAAFIGTSVFIVGFIATYVRFVPYIKKNYEYGVVVFLLTFNLITVSGYRVENVTRMNLERLYTIAIGCGICLFMSLLVLPNWSGEDLHSSTVYKLEGLARSIEDCVDQYFQDTESKGFTDKSSKDLIYEDYRAVLDSKSSDESLALFASWEPRYSRHCRRYPWQQYVKLGAILRHFAYTAIALHGCLGSEIQTPRSVRSLFEKPCIQIAREVSKVLTELAINVKERRHCSLDVLSSHLQEALQDLNSAIKSQPPLFLDSKSYHQTTNILADWKPDKETGQENCLASTKTGNSALLECQTNKLSDQSKESTERKMLRPTLSKMAITNLEFSKALPFAAFASLIVEMVARLDLVIEGVKELASKAHFKEFSPKDDVLIEVNTIDKRHNGSVREPHNNLVSEAGD